MHPILIFVFFVFFVFLISILFCYLVVASPRFRHIILAPSINYYFAFPFGISISSKSVFFKTITIEKINWRSGLQLSLKGDHVCIVASRKEKERPIPISRSETTRVGLLFRKVLDQIGLLFFYPLKFLLKKVFENCTISISNVHIRYEDTLSVDLPMLKLHGKWGLSDQSFLVRVQQPRVIVAPDFLQAVYESFGTVQSESSATPSLIFEAQSISFDGIPGSMRAVLNLEDFAASTFNIPLDAWEPLVEPFEGQLTFEKYASNPSQPERMDKRVEVSANTILNVNISASNLNTLAEATASWRKHRELEEKALRLYEEADKSDVRKSAHAEYLKTREDCEVLPNNRDATLSCFSASRYRTINSCLIQNMSHCMPEDERGSKFDIKLNVAKLGLSIVDHIPEEILYLSLKCLSLSYSTGPTLGTARLNMSMGDIQIDNQLQLTPLPVLFGVQRDEDESDHILELSIIQDYSGSLDLCKYPVIDLKVPQSTAFLVQIHEPIIWRLNELIQKVDISNIFGSQTTCDPFIQIGALNISRVRFIVTMTITPTQRPAGVLGNASVWATIFAAIANARSLEVCLKEREQENLYMRYSDAVTNARSNIVNDVYTSKRLKIIFNVLVMAMIANASAAFDCASEGVASLSKDKKFMQKRKKQDNKPVRNIGDGFKVGGEALTNAIISAASGIVTKPLKGAKSSGVPGFAKGAVKGIVDSVTKPVSGGMYLCQKVAQGADATTTKTVASCTFEAQLQRRRLPRAIGGDNLLKPYDKYKANGQAIMQLVGKFSSDVYDHHVEVRGHEIVLLTDRRITLLKPPTKKEFNISKHPYSVVWMIEWADLHDMKLRDGDHSIILYKQSNKSTKKNSVSHLIQGEGDVDINQLYNAIERYRDMQEEST